MDQTKEGERQRERERERGQEKLSVTPNRGTYRMVYRVLTHLWLGERLASLRPASPGGPGEAAARCGGPSTKELDEESGAPPEPRRHPLTMVRPSPP